MQPAASTADRCDAAASTIQARVRKRKEERNRDAAATLIQARLRGKQATAAVRRKIAELQQTVSEGVVQLFSFFTGWGSPIRGAVSLFEFQDLSPKEANCIERFRDRWLAAMARFEMFFVFMAIFLGLSAVWAIVFVAVLFFPLNLGVPVGNLGTATVEACNISQYNESWILSPGDAVLPPRVAHIQHPIDVGEGDFVAHHCTPAQYWVNICFKTLSFYFGYVNFLPIPWTLSICVHAYNPHHISRDKIGVDFYGRNSDSLWFHLTNRRRRIIATLNLVALLFQIPDCLFHAVVYHTYLEISTWPGNLNTNWPLIGQLSMQITAAMIQSRGEANVRKERPGKFPPTLGQFLSAEYKKWKAANKASGRRCMLPSSFVKHILEAMQSGGQQVSVGTLTGVDYQGTLQRGRTTKINIPTRRRAVGEGQRHRVHPTSMDDSICGPQDPW